MLPAFFRHRYEHIVLYGFQYGLQDPEAVSYTHLDVYKRQDQWSERDYEVLVKCLKNTAETGGLVLGAFADGKLKGLVSVEGRPMGRAGNYRDLSSLHVSEECRGMGIGRALFDAAADWARNQGAEKLYISGHSAVETQAFYRAMGCVEAQEYDPVHTAAEPYDCQLEFVFARTERRGENGTIS